MLTMLLANDDFAFRESANIVEFPEPSIHDFANCTHLIEGIRGTLPSASKVYFNYDRDFKGMLVFYSTKVRTLLFNLTEWQEEEKQN